MHAAPSPEGLWSPARRALTIGLVLTITLVAFEALAISTVMPTVIGELGQLELYGWVFSAFFLASLIGIVIVGGVIDRRGLALPFAIGLGLFAIGLLVGGLAPSMPVLVAARFVQGLGAGTIPPIAYVAIGRSLPESLRARMFATLSTAWILPGVLGPTIAAGVGQTVGWRFVFLGLLPLIALSGALTLGALRAVVAAPARQAAEASASAADRARLPLAIAVAVGAGLVTLGLTAGELVPTIVLVAARPADRDPRAAAADPGGDAAGTAGPAGGRAPARAPDLHVLRGRCLRPARPRRLARPLADRIGDRPDRGDDPLDGRVVDPGPRFHAVVQCAVRPGRFRRGPGGAGVVPVGPARGRVVAGRHPDLRPRRVRHGPVLLAARPDRPPARRPRRTTARRRVRCR